MVERMTSSRRYRKILRKIMKDTGREISASLITAYAAAQEDENGAEAGLLLLLTFSILNQAARDAKVSVSQLLASESVYLDKLFIAGVKKATATDIAALIGESDTKLLIENIVKRNVSLITDLTEQTRGKIERAVLDAQINNTPARELKKELNKILGSQAKRGDLIAFDQLEKLAAELTGFRAQQAGLTKYIWRTQGDDRVRYLHNELNGKLQDITKAHHGDNNRLPRVPIRCRCWAEWVIEKYKG